VARICESVFDAVVMVIGAVIVFVPATLRIAPVESMPEKVWFC